MADYGLGTDSNNMFVILEFPKFDQIQTLDPLFIADIFDKKNKKTQNALTKNIVVTYLSIWEIQTFQMLESAGHHVFENYVWRVQNNWC